MALCGEAYFFSNDYKNNLIYLLSKCYSMYNDVSNPDIVADLYNARVRDCAYAKQKFTTSAQAKKFPEQYILIL